MLLIKIATEYASHKIHTTNALNVTAEVCHTSTLHNLVNLAFNMQLRMLRLNTFKFDRHFFRAGHICA